MELLGQRGASWHPAPSPDLQCSWAVLRGAARDSLVPWLSGLTGNRGGGCYGGQVVSTPLGLPDLCLSREYSLLWKLPSTLP